MNCPSCQRSLAADASSCPACGTATLPSSAATLLPTEVDGTRLRSAGDTVRRGPIPSGVAPGGASPTSSPQMFTPGGHVPGQRRIGAAVALGACVCVLVFSAFIAGYLLISLVRGF